ncbi:hypothetical protein BJ085DRAFT_33179 [Dimargaris cristalligena]|uniref:Uncharacterized protein n=1 Tax=Dimargaris cristalligena TaxID=215637 RepID=A0A4P9ZS68_9FUNG|nr:hypothetical protein BJ085DRAFT_33179 [Dimargaris cristalligena]|eukprot:RKP36245.1 hypothetical protein BJ085DRAFT_33179 [Dimargaris cristalligena]
MLRSFSTQTASANIAGIARGLIRSGRIVEAAHLCQTSRDVAAVEASIGAILRPMLSSTSPPNSALLRPPAAPTSDAVSPADTAHGNGHQKQLPTLLFFLDHLYPPKPAPVAPTRPGGSGATDRLTLSRSLVSAEYAAPFYRIYSGEPLGGVRAIFDDMHHGPVQPNPVTYLVMMYGYARQAQPEPVAELLVQLQKVHPGQVTIAHYGVLMYAYSRANRVRGVLRVWDDIQARFRHPNAKVTNILLLALIRGGQPRLAIDVFQQLAHRISPSFFASSSHPPSPSTAPIPSATSYFPLSVLSPPSSPASALASAPTLSPTSTPTLTTIPSPTSTPPPASPSPSSTPHPRTRASQRDEEHNASLLIRAHLLNNNLAEAWQMFGRIRCQDPTINSHILESFLRYFIKQSDLWSCERVFNTIDQSSVKSVYWVDYLQLITLAYENRHYILVARFYESMRQKYLNHFPPLLRSGEGSPLARHTLRNWPAFLHLVTGAKPPIATPPLLRGEPYRPICRVQDHQALAQPTMPNRLDGLAIPAAQNERIALGCLKAERPSLALLAYHDYLQYPGVQPIPALEEVFAHLSVAN